ncbi:hypothetical protein EFP84_06870 [Leptospira kmetyi]|uniref:Uncharacterized protein n=1 Tax=Leptospira kmetyi TaxID=408139 RepID=A0A5F1XTD9_9LEPT|nr:hypothetical protein EFP84_06870 [Leptospira kmetyi]TGK16941.1 hypothetical protein EHO62_14670 [Leptospira kmetyi]TGK32968.1 hypothetical protein EHO66_04335 [Leptospira kmetyi]
MSKGGKFGVWLEFGIFTGDSCKVGIGSSSLNLVTEIFSGNAPGSGAASFYHRGIGKQFFL